MLDDKIIQVANDHRLIIDAAFIDDGEVVVAKKAEFVACVKDILVSCPRNEFDNEQHIKGLF